MLNSTLCQSIQLVCSISPALLSLSFSSAKSFLSDPGPSECRPWIDPRMLFWLLSTTGTPLQIALQGSPHARSPTYLRSNTTENVARGNVCEPSPRVVDTEVGVFLVRLCPQSSRTRGS